MPVRIFSDEIEQEIISIYRTDPDESISSLARRYGCKRSTLRYIFKRNGVDTSKKPVRSNRYTFNYRFFDHLDHEIPIYWLGFIYADGHVNKISSLIINISDKDRQHLEKFKCSINATYKIHTPNYGGYKQARLQLTHPHFANRLRELGILVRRPSISLSLSKIPEPLLNHFVRGLFDGDGCALKHDPGIDFAGNKNTTMWLKNLFTENFSLPTNKKLHKIAHDCYSLRYQGSNITSKIVLWIYSNATIYLERKYEIFQRHGIFD